MKLPIRDSLGLQHSMAVTFTTSVLLASLTLTLAMPVTEYSEARKKMLDGDLKTQLGHSLQLSDDEKIVSNALVTEKTKMIEASRKQREDYFPAWSFYKSKPMMEKSMIFKLIKKMPKGAALHLHDQAIASIDWLVKNATYRDHLYMCIDQKTYRMHFRFHAVTPKAKDDCNSWSLVKDERKMAKSVEEFDESIKKNISMLTTDPMVDYPTVTAVWDRFMLYFGQAFDIIFYAPVFRDYFWQALQEFYDDSVQYIELRSLFYGVYDLDGTIHGREKAFELYREVTEQFTASHPDFIGAKFIMSGLRIASQSDILEEVKETMAMRDEYPHFMLGYDLVGQEDPNNPLLYYRDALLYPSQTDPTKGLPYFFHAAETNWQGTETDYNLIDAILLNTTRIGHGFGLVKHPSLVQTVKDRQIAIEVNPLSNQMLGLVKDPRNHPASPLMADNMPVVISSDDPAVWEAAPLSHDFYVAFMNMLGEDADLRALKQLAINSIKYSAMDAQEKSVAMTKWTASWKEFIAAAAKSITRGN